MMKRLSHSVKFSSIAALPLIAVVAAKALSPLLTLWALLACIRTSRAKLLQMWREFWQQHRPVLLSMLALILWAGLSSAWSVSASESLEGFFKLCGITLSGLAALSMIKLPDLSDRMHRLLTGSFLMILAVLTLEIFTPITLLKWLADIWGEPYLQLVESRLNRGLAALAVLIWPLAYYLHRHGAAVMAACCIVIFFTLLTHLYSASALVGMVVPATVLSALFLSPHHFTKLVKYAAPLALLAALFVCILVFYPVSSEDFARELRPYSSSRTLIWHSLLQNFEGSWWLGDGMRTSHLIPMAQRFLTEMRLEGAPLYPHLSPLQLVLELGIIGLILGLIFVYHLFAQLSKIPDGLRRNWALACATSYLCVGLFAFNVWMNWWLAYGFILAILFRPPYEYQESTS